MPHAFRWWLRSEETSVAQIGFSTAVVFCSLNYLNNLLHNNIKGSVVMKLLRKLIPLATASPIAASAFASGNTDAATSFD